MLDDEMFLIAYLKCSFIGYQALGTKSEFFLPAMLMEGYLCPPAASIMLNFYWIQTGFEKSMRITAVNVMPIKDGKIFDLKYECYH